LEGYKKNIFFFKSIGTLLKRIVVVPKMLKDPSVRTHKKFIVIGGLIYILSPIDIIADPILGFGFIDDAVLMVYIISKIQEELDKYISKSTNKDKVDIEQEKIIEHVDYKIDDE